MAPNRLSMDDIPCNHPPPPKPPATAYDYIMAIQVTQGSIKKDFCVYRSVLCFHSKVFDKALNGPFKEGGSDVYEMKDCAIETFEMFFNWMNTGVASTTDKGEDLNEQQAVDLFVFADFYGILALTNDALEIYFRSFAKKWKVEYGAIKSIYDRTPENSNLRRLAVDILTDVSVFENFRTVVTTSGFSIDFMLDVLETFRDKKMVPGSYMSLRVNGCEGWKRIMKAKFCAQYHDHAQVHHYGKLA
ncbi:hypothetical protein N0V90_009434 [Kalmusia sp. IMI 367209]|nr:hypothetical protein N0V90_009434 [Kalmusia sp. IMI 367209]